MSNKLSEGVVGRELIAFFEREEGKTPTWAECIGSNDRDQYNYRITFSDDTVADYHVTFESGRSFVVLSAEEFNRVI